MEVLYECFSCDYCHRVGTGITIINGFKMCPMCLAEYQHKSGENNKLREELEKQARLIVYQENENAKLKIENEQLKQQLAEKNKLLEKENKALEIACKKIEDLRFENADICDYEYNEIKTEIRIKLLLEEAEEALKKLNKE